MSDDEQHLDVAGGPPPTNPGPSGGVDGGNGRPDPQRQGDGRTNRNGQTNPQLNEENIGQHPEAVDDNLQHGVILTNHRAHLGEIPSPRKTSIIPIDHRAPPGKTPNDMENNNGVETNL